MSNGLRVCISTGHYKASKGAYNKKYDLHEYDVCKRISFELYNSLKISEENNIGEIIFVENKTLPEKRDEINRIKPDIIIENHMNSSWIKSHSGVLTIYKEGCHESLLLAAQVHERLVKDLISKDLCIYNDNICQGWRKWKQFFFFDRIEAFSEILQCEAPRILTEIDFLSNPKIAEMIIKNDNFIKTAAKAIGNGIKAYAKNKKE